MAVRPSTGSARPSPQRRRAERVNLDRTLSSPRTGAAAAEAAAKPTKTKPMATITVVTLTGGTTEVVVDLSRSVAELKAKIQDMEGIPPDQQRLVCGGSLMWREDEKVSTYGLVGGGKVDLLLHLRASGDAQAKPSGLRATAGPIQKKAGIMNSWSKFWGSVSDAPDSDGSVFRWRKERDSNKVQGEVDLGTAISVGRCSAPKAQEDELEIQGSDRVYRFRAASPAVWEAVLKAAHARARSGALQERIERMTERITEALEGQDIDTAAGLEPLLAHLEKVPYTCGWAQHLSNVLLTNDARLIDGVLRANERLGRLTRRIKEMIPDSSSDDASSSVSSLSSDQGSDESEDDLEGSVEDCERHMGIVDSFVKMYLMRRDAHPPNPEYIRDMAKCVRDRVAGLEECQHTLCGFLNAAMAAPDELSKIMSCNDAVAAKIKEVKERVCPELFGGAPGA
jgi:hypothetical protein